MDNGPNKVSVGLSRSTVVKEGQVFVKRFARVSIQNCVLTIFFLKTVFFKLFQMNLLDT